MIRDDGRKALAKAMPLMDVVGKLGLLPGLKRAGGEWVGGCPVCGDGGKANANRFGVSPARGVWNCRTCATGGDGLALVQHVLGCDFRTALDELLGTEISPVSPEELQRRKELAAAADKKREETQAYLRGKAIQAAREIWHAAHPGEGSPAMAYLAGRGITFPSWPPTLRFLPAHPYTKGGTTFHRGPCMIAAIQAPGGQVRAVHQTWLNPDKPGEKATILDADGVAQVAKLVRGSKKGGAIRLTAQDSGARMVMGEGIETTASALMAGIWPGATLWAGVDLGNMAGVQAKIKGKQYSGIPDMSDALAWVPPDWVRHLLFIQDGDSAPKPTRAKLEAGAIRAMKTRPGLVAKIMEAAPGTDLNDMLTKKAVIE